MPVRKPNLYPPFNIVRAAYVDYLCTDLALSKSYWVDALGWLLTEQTEDALYLRGIEERNHHSVVLRKSAQPGVAGRVQGILRGRPRQGRELLSSERHAPQFRD